MKILDAKWVKEEGELKLLVVTHDKKFKLIDPRMNPYFFIKKQDYWDVKWMLKGTEVETDSGAETLDGVPVVKISVDFPDQVRSLRDKLESKGIDTFESDIPFVKRWMTVSYTHLTLPTN